MPCARSTTEAWRSRWARATPRSGLRGRTGRRWPSISASAAGPAAGTAGGPHPPPAGHGRAGRRGLRGGLRKTPGLYADGEDDPETLRLGVQVRAGGPQVRHSGRNTSGDRGTIYTEPLLQNRQHHLIRHDLPCPPWRGGPVVPSYWGGVQQMPAKPLNSIQFDGLSGFYFPCRRWKSGTR